MRQELQNLKLSVDRDKNKKKGKKGGKVSKRIIAMAKVHRQADIEIINCTVESLIPFHRELYRLTRDYVYLG